MIESEMEAKKIDTKHISVLYVDDEKQNLRVLYLLMKRKFNVHIASNAEEALEILSKEKVHVILSDQKMQGMNGSELLEKVGETYPNIIKMLLTGDENQISVQKAMKNQDIFACINKPFDKTSLGNLFIEGYNKLVDEGLLIY